MDPVRKLKAVYQKYGLVIAVGAGLSVGCQVPSWPAVLRRLAARCYEDSGEKIFERLVEDGYSLPAIAGILKASCPDPFIDWLRDEIYREFAFKKPMINEGTRQEFIEVVERNRTLSAVAELCVAWDETQGIYRRNPLVHAIVNFNFDAIFREYVRERYGHGILRTVERASAGELPGRTPVYHMHGYLHFDMAKMGNARQESPDAIVLTEQEFFDFFNRPTEVYTYTFLHLLRSHHCLFVGLSLKDDNLRRLLHYSRAERIDSDLREGRTVGEAETRALRHFALLSCSDEKTYDSVIEKSLNRLGVSVVWMDSYDEIAPILQELHRDRATPSG